jgi:hypothetical protein
VVGDSHAKYRGVADHSPVLPKTHKVDAMSEPNIPSPDPSLATNERLAHAIRGQDERLQAAREEIKNWVEKLQELLEEKIESAEDKTENLDRVVQTRLTGSETALNAAMAAADKVTQEIKLNFGAVLNELKAGMTKQIEALNEKVEDLKKRVFESGGHAQGAGQTVSMVIAAVAALAAVIAAIVVLSRPAPPPAPTPRPSSAIFKSEISHPTKYSAINTVILKGF